MESSQTLFSSIVLVLLGALIPFIFNIYKDHRSDEKARKSRLQGLLHEIEANILLVNAPNITGEGGKPRLLNHALQGTQNDWFTFKNDLQAKLQKLNAEINVFNMKVDLFLSVRLSGLDSGLRNFFPDKAAEINTLLEDCKKELTDHL